MASITIRKLDKSLKERLRTQAASNGRSIEEEARVIICRALTRSEPCGLGSRIHARFARVGGVDLDSQALRSTDLAGSRAVTR